MMKVLTGVYQMDAGEILLDGKPVQIHDTRDAQALGISIIHQELNLMIGSDGGGKHIHRPRADERHTAHKRKQNEMAAELLSSLSIDISPTTIVGTLTVARQQMVEIAKALSYDNTRILIMDEPSAALTESEIEELFRFIRDLKARGVGIVYISHRMGELKEISDRITVMRDGPVCRTVNTAEVTMDEIIRMMVGRVHLRAAQGKEQRAAGRPHRSGGQASALQGRQGRFLRAAQGRDSRLCRPDGAGRTETARLVSGADQRLGGEILVNGKEVNIQTPADAVKAGIGYLSEDRKRYGLCLPLSVADNTVMATLHHFLKGSVVNDKKIREVSHTYREQINIKNAFGGHQGSLPLGRQPAEGRSGQVAGARLRHTHLRRADPRHRRRRQERDLQADEPPGGGGQVHHHDLLGAAGASAHV